MRKQLLSVFLPLLALALMAAAAETQSADTGATKRAALQRLDILRGDDGISIEITARGQVTPKLSTLDSPARVIVDLPDTVAVTDQRHITVGSDGIKDVRIGMDGQTPPNTRVVIDLDQACHYELVPGGDNKIVLKLHPELRRRRTRRRPLPRWRLRRQRLRPRSRCWRRVNRSQTHQRRKSRYRRLPTPVTSYSLNRLTSRRLTLSRKTPSQ